MRFTFVEIFRDRCSLPGMTRCNGQENGRWLRLDQCMQVELAIAPCSGVWAGHTCRGADFVVEGDHQRLLMCPLDCIVLLAAALLYA